MDAQRRSMRQRARSNVGREKAQPYPADIRGDADGIRCAPPARRGLPAHHLQAILDVAIREAREREISDSGRDGLSDQRHQSGSLHYCEP